MDWFSRSPKHVYNVKKWGAEGDGRTVDVVAIQRAINAITGSTLYFPAGTYIVSASAPESNNILTLAKTGLIIRGDGPGVSIIKVADACPTFEWLLGPSTATGLELRDLTIDYNADNNFIIKNNLLVNEDASVETGIGHWDDNLSTCTVAQSNTQAFHGMYSAKMTLTAVGGYSCLSCESTTTNAQHTFSCRAKCSPVITLRLRAYGNASGFGWGPEVTADNTWQALTVTHTWAGDVVRRVYLYAYNATVGDIIYWDAFQLETGAVATTFYASEEEATHDWLGCICGMYAGTDADIHDIGIINATDFGRPA